MLLYHDDTALLLPYSPHLPIANLVPFTTTTDDITSSSCFSVACSKLVSLVLDLPSSSLGYQRVACCCTTLTGICTISLTERIHTHTVLLLLICASSACACMSLLSVGLSTSKGWGRLQYSQTAVPATCAFFFFVRFRKCAEWRNVGNVRERFPSTSTSPPTRDALAVP